MHFVDDLRSYTQRPPVWTLDCNPYADASCQTLPPVPRGVVGSGSYWVWVCGVKFDRACLTYTLQTFRDE